MWGWIDNNWNFLFRVNFSFKSKHTSPYFYTLLKCSNLESSGIFYISRVSINVFFCAFGKYPIRKSQKGFFPLPERTWPFFFFFFLVNALDGSWKLFLTKLWCSQHITRVTDHLFSFFPFLLHFKSSSQICLTIRWSHSYRVIMCVTLSSFNTRPPLLPFPLSGLANTCACRSILSCNAPEPSLTAASVAPISEIVISKVA